ncbi:pyridoxine-5'-phosphate oxidase-like isoform X2 [Mya arenaria]|uniref:pyridoxine-5'-phosphate oxidase-like isoform X2 n=1 Tax=Mya arenaria TaxID=6604 RepID=UPI0022E110CC|nr:pyridoxine-5'-phosphate oxidase-like isoform X2 [Mya arenaria]
MADLQNMRKSYHDADSIFDVNDLSSRNPMKQFEAWFNDICAHKSIEEPNAMAIATATKSGIPSVRMVLCKGLSPEGFTFYTNFASKKGNELAENPNCSLMFYWEPLKRSVRVEGIAELIPEEKSEEYFQSRPKESQLGAMVSKQSSVIENRQVLDKKLKDLREQFDSVERVDKPKYWGGFLIRPYAFEFWQGQTNRLHDRLTFRKLAEGEKFNPDVMTKGEEEWIIERLSS